ncbi:MAG TPA: helix-turn-helix domain-containing protein [Puia sp.]
MTGQKLRVLREFRNYSQEYIAEKLGITQNAYSRIENNQTKITAERLGRLAVILNIPPMELLSDKEPVLHFSDPSSHPGQSPKEDHWKEMIENTRQLYGQVIVSKDEKIAFLENEIYTLRKERDRIIHLIEKLTSPGIMASAGIS